MKGTLLCAMVFMILPFFLSAQKDSLQSEINQQVWIPFISAFNSKDNTIMKSIHSRDLCRVTKDNSQIIGYDENFKPIPDSIKAKWGTWKSKLELRFTQRIASNGRAFETGYYKNTSINSSTNETRINYGKFDVLSRKEYGKWKILMDEDGKEGTTEEIFNAANANTNPRL